MKEEHKEISKKQGTKVKMSNPKNLRLDRNTFSCNSSEEDENISDNEDYENKNTRLNIQEAVS